MKRSVFKGTAFHAPARGSLEVLEEVLIVVGRQGSIEAVVPSGAPDYEAVRQEAAEAGALIELEGEQYLLPGFVDLHVHAPQWPQLGKALDAPLEEWLERYTFPLEERYADVAFARQVYDDLVNTLLANGTTTAVYFATIHTEASVELARICLERGQRALVGRVAMDHPEQCPPSYRDRDAETAIAETRRFAEEVRRLCPGADPLVATIVTPRFLPSCTDALLHGLGSLARELGCPVQTHCSESDWVVAHDAGRFGGTDVEALRGFGLLGRNTILAHSNFVSEGDLHLIRSHGASIAHCPLSNAYFANAILPLRYILDAAVQVGLGTDISGGHSPFILDACRHALLAARIRQGGIDPGIEGGRRGVSGASITVPEAFWLATAGGGEAIGLPVGLFAPGYRFDALLVDVNTPASNVRAYSGHDTPGDVLQKILLNASRDNIAAVWVEGRQVRGRTDRIAMP